MRMYIPDNWVILRMKSGHETNYKILAGWYGEYTTGDSGKLSSGITQVKEFTGVYELLSYSGSTYRCLENTEGFSILTHSMLESWNSKAMVESLVNIERISMDEFLEEWHNAD